MDFRSSGHEQSERSPGLRLFTRVKFALVYSAGKRRDAFDLHSPPYDHVLFVPQESE